MNSSKEIIFKTLYQPNKSSLEVKLAKGHQYETSARSTFVLHSQNCSRRPSIYLGSRGHEVMLMGFVMKSFDYT